MSEYKRRIEATSYNQEYAHCNGFNIRKCEYCFRRHLADSMPKFGIQRANAIKPVIVKDDCMMFVNIKNCEEEVRELQKRIDLYEDEQMDKV